MGMIFHCLLAIISSLYMYLCALQAAEARVKQSAALFWVL